MDIAGCVKAHNYNFAPGKDGSLEMQACLLPALFRLFQSTDMSKLNKLLEDLLGNLLGNLPVLQRYEDEDSIMARRQGAKGLSKSDSCSFSYVSVPFNDLGQKNNNNNNFRYVFICAVVRTIVSFRRSFWGSRSGWNVSSSIWSSSWSSGSGFHNCCTRSSSSCSCSSCCSEFKQLYDFIGKADLDYFEKGDFKVPFFCRRLSSH